MCMYVCIYMYIYIHVHTYIYIYINISIIIKCVYWLLQLCCVKDLRGMISGRLALADWLASSLLFVCRHAMCCSLGMGLGQQRVLCVAWLERLLETEQPSGSEQFDQPSDSEHLDSEQR